MNPILPGFYPDPSVCRVGPDYYLVSSSFEYFPGVPIFHSRNLTDWRQLGHVLTRDSQLPLERAKSSKGIFAPTLREHAGTFYMITTNMSVGKSFYVTSRDPAGPWSDPVWIQEQAFSMDPSLFFDDDGKVYYTRHGGGERGGVYQAEIDLTTGALAAEARQIWAGTGGVWPEAPHLYKVKGTYYLLIAEGGTGPNHEVTVARSASPWGPFEACPRNPIFTHKLDPAHPIQATGHADLVQAQDDRWWMVFLGIRQWDGAHHHLGRETFLAPVAWDAAGWPVINENRYVDLELPSSGLPGATSPVATFSERVRDDFGGSELALWWNFLRNPAPASWSLTERPGWLRLRGSPVTLDEEAQVTFLGRRQQHYRCRITAKLEFAPNAPGQEAGLVVRADESNHYDLVVHSTSGQRTVTLRSRVAGTSKQHAELAVSDEPLLLQVEAFPDRYQFFVTQAGRTQSGLGSLPTIPFSSEETQGFTGTYFGMFAVNGAALGALPADFDWFEYEPLS